MQLLRPNCTVLVTDYDFFGAHYKAEELTGKALPKTRRLHRVGRGQVLVVGAHEPNAKQFLMGQRIHFWVGRRDDYPSKFKRLVAERMVGDEFKDNVAHLR